MLHVKKKDGSTVPFDLKKLEDVTSWATEEPNKQWTADLNAMFKMDPPKPKVVHGIVNSLYGIRQKDIKAGKTLWIIHTQSRLSALSYECTELRVVPIYCLGKPKKNFRGHPYVSATSSWFKDTWVMAHGGSSSQLMLQLGNLISSYSDGTLNVYVGDIYVDSQYRLYGTYRQALKAAVAMVEKSNKLNASLPAPLRKRGDGPFVLVKPELTGAEETRLGTKKSAKSCVEDLKSFMKDKQIIIFTPTHNKPSWVEKQYLSHDDISIFPGGGRPWEEPEIYLDLKHNHSSESTLQIKRDKQRPQDPLVKMRFNALLPLHIENETKLFDPDAVKRLQESAKEATNMRLQENPDSPSIVMNNKPETWEVANVTSTKWIMGDENTDEVVIEFYGPTANTERNNMIDALSAVDAWPDGYTPEKR